MTTPLPWSPAAMRLRMRTRSGWLSARNCVAIWSCTSALATAGHHPSGDRRGCGERDAAYRGGVFGGGDLHDLLREHRLEQLEGLRVVAVRDRLEHLVDLGIRLVDGVVHR